MTVSLIAAVASNGVIGSGGELPWRLPIDLKHFKRTTKGKPVIMGRKTWESIGSKPLKKRLNIVLSRDPDYRLEGAELASGLEEALALCGDADEIMVVGGEAIYRAALPRADRLYLTHVELEVAGDARFPEVDLGEWRVVEERAYEPDDRHAHAFRIVTYER